MNQSNSATVGSDSTAACSLGGEDGDPSRCSLECPVAASVASISELPPRRHGRFLVQPISASPLQTSSMSSRSASPGGTAIRSMSSPSANASLISERRPSRIIGRFEVSELLPTVKSTSVVIQELSTAANSGDTTPLKSGGANH